MWFPKMPARLFLSSGDLIADRRFEFARDLQLGGDLPAAAELLEKAIELAPNFPTAWFTLGEVRQELGAEEITAMPRGYVQALFDQYAPRFEDALLGDLNYRAPQLLFKAVVRVRVGQKKPAFFK